MDLVQVPPIDIEVTGMAFRAVIDDASVAESVRAVLADSLNDQPGTLGLILEAPSDDNGLYRLLDRTGITLARARTADELTGPVIAHLASLIDAASGPTRGQVLVKLRALAHTDGTATLLTPPFGINPTLAERRLDKAGLALVDHAVLTVDAGGAIQPVASTPLAPTPGHINPAEALRIERIATMAAGGPQATATIASHVAGVCAGDRSDVFTTAVALAQRSVLGVDHADSAALYRALSG